MKPRHAAALALVGWYLMYPPDQQRGWFFSREWQLDEDAPLSKWKTASSYDSARACNSQLEQWKDAANDPKTATEFFKDYKKAEVPEATARLNAFQVYRD